MGVANCAPKLYVNKVPRTVVTTTDSAIQNRIMMTSTVQITCNTSTDRP